MHSPSHVELSPSQRHVVSHRGGHLQVIACAGSGKTEAVSRRVAALVAEGVDPAGIVAFTFTEKAAAELKDRIIRRVAEVKGEDFKGRLAQMFVGTIHGYCFKLLQDHVPAYGNYDVLEPNRHAGLLAREQKNLKIRERLKVEQYWKAIEAFSTTVDVIGNELITPEQLGATPLGELYRDYLATLDRYHFLTFGLIIQKAVDALKDPAVFERVHPPLRHLIVDEYQDINPAQEALIRRLGSGHVHVCVVGDDDQSIYQWRGSQTENILTFKGRYQATAVTLDANRRSRAEIVVRASEFAASIEPRLEKTMKAIRESHPTSVVAWSAETPDEEAATIARTIKAMHAKGTPYRDMAILLRSVKTSAGPYITAFREQGIPVTCAGRRGLFMLPEIDAIGRIYSWFAGIDWRAPGYDQQSEPIEIASLAATLRKAFRDVRPLKEVRKFLEDWQSVYDAQKSPINLVGDYYKLLHFLKVHEFDLAKAEDATRMGSLARFSNILADYENVTRRARWVEENGTRTFRGGQSHGAPFLWGLANFIQHYARDSYEEFDGDESSQGDAVEITTIHQSKGLEWPVVFMPALDSRRFPSSNAGKGRDWLLPLDLFPEASRSRYEGGDQEERRLFYVAMTRARDTLYLSHYRKINRASRASRYLVELVGEKGIKPLTELPLHDGPPSPNAAEHDKVSVSFSELSDFDDCGHRYRLSAAMGFETQLVSELGYGRAIHHVLRSVAETARAQGSPPSEAAVQAILDREFYLPFANAANFETMRASAQAMVHMYVRKYRDDLTRIWATERPFEMHLAGGTLSGRADVILSHHEGRPDSLAIVDYKTAKDTTQDAAFAFQLAIYAAAGRGEGLQIDAALLHDLKRERRDEVDISPEATRKAVAKVDAMMTDLRQGNYLAKPEQRKCGACEYCKLCPHAIVDPWDRD